MGRRELEIERGARALYEQKPRRIGWEEAHRATKEEYRRTSRVVRAAQLASTRSPQAQNEIEMDVDYVTDLLREGNWQLIREWIDRRISS